MVAVVAFLQWRTAHQKVVLDLFDRRIAMIDELRRIIAELIQQSHVWPPDLPGRGSPPMTW
jgi:hypothetical protein